MNSSTPSDAIPPDEPSKDEIFAADHPDSPGRDHVAASSEVSASSSSSSNASINHHLSEDESIEDPDCYETIMAALYDPGGPDAQGGNGIHASDGFLSEDDNANLGPTVDQPGPEYHASSSEPMATQAVDTDQIRSDATIDQPGPPHAGERPMGDGSADGSNRPKVSRTQEPPQDKSSLPERVGKFAIRRELGRGAFGVVYLGYDEELQRNVAIKVSLVSDPSRQAKLKTEASKAAQIESSGIVPVYHIGTTDQGLVFIVHKYIPGCSLRDILKRGPLSPMRATTLMRDLALAMAPAHQLDILHRDLKPDNVLIDKKGNAWIADFGLAISEREQNSRRRELAGTPPYMSPEQIKGRVDFLDPRSDLWALGVMYYELLSGKLPFRGKSRESLTDQICERDPRPLQQYGAKFLTDEINQVFSKACSKAPADRYATVIEFATALDDLIEVGLSDQNILGESTEDWIGADDSDFLPLRSQTSRRTVSRSRSGSTQTDVASTAGSTKQTKYMVTISALAVIVLGLLGWQQRTRNDDRVPIPGDITIEPDPDPTTIGASTSVLKSLDPDRDLDGTAKQDASSSTITDEPSSTSSITNKVAGATPDSMSVAVTNKSHLSEIDGEKEPLEVLTPLPAGTRNDPMIVATDGTGSHTRVSDAVEDAPDGGFITIGPGQYRESLTFKKSLTLVGDNPKDDASQRIEFTNDTRAVITVDSSDAEVLIENIRIAGRGTKMTEEFNAVEVVAGTLLTSNVDLTTSSYNCVKVLSGATYGAKNCEYLDSRNIAVSAKDHANLQLIDCRFRGSGVEVIGGGAAISGCEFYGTRGVWCQRNQSMVRVVGCKFENDRSSSIASLSGGNVSVAKCQFLKGSKAVQVLDGQLLLKPGCVVNDYAVGAFVSSGKLTMQSTEITESSDSAVQIIGKSDVVLNHCKIDQAGAFGIDIISGKLNFSGGSIANCSLACVNLSGLEDEDENQLLMPMNVTLKECTLISADVGIKASRGNLWLEQVFFESGKTKPGGVGIFADGGKMWTDREPKESQDMDQADSMIHLPKPRLFVRVADTVRFDESVKISIFAKGNTMLDVSDKTRQSIQDTAKVLTPARFKEAELSSSP